LTQEELAERAGLHAQEISKLERGVRRAPRSITVQLLADALKLGTQQKAAFVAAARGRPLHDTPHSYASPDAHPDPADPEAVLASMPTDALPPRAPLPAGSRMPLAPNPLFVGRGDELLQVARALRGADATVALGQVVASTGLGGLGKTQLAVELVHRYGRFFAGGVFWLSFASADEIPLQFAACAGSGAVGLEADLSSRPLEERVKLVMGAWQSPVPRLLIFDNCEEESLLETWRPTSGGCRVLVTSRRSHWSPTLGVATLPLDLLPRPDSIELLRRYRPDLAAADLRLDALASKLGDLPLALHLAGRYLLAYRAEVSLDEYLAELDQPALIGHASLLGAGLDDSPSPTHHVQSVAQTFALCLRRLDRGREVDRVAIALLARMACMAPGEPVPRDLLAKTLEDVNPLRRSDALRRLGAVGLVEEGEGWLRLHRLIAGFVRQETDAPEARAAVERVLVDFGEDAERGHLNKQALTAVIPHMVHAASRSDRDELTSAQLCSAAGLVLRHAADLDSARRWLEVALAIVERICGASGTDTARALNRLASVLQVQGQLAAAQPLFERAVAIRWRVLGASHADTAESLNNLALLLWNLGDAARAKPLYECALAVYEHVLGPDHPDTATALNNLALLLQDQGELAAAHRLLERALAIFEGTHGSDHPLTATALNNLGRLFRARGESGTARVLVERALAIRMRVLGPDHPETATSLRSLGRVLQTQGDPAAALPLFERALAIRERVLGLDHPDTVATRLALVDLAAEADGPSTVT
jgi:tetratricopeptide (TPR) repeat protein/transcriptional regulator with XRE-family HTH domain